MTEAQKSPLFNSLFSLYVSHLLRRHFNRILVRFPSLPLSGPRIYIANHNTWWDGFFLCALNDLYLRDELYVMMREEQFLKFPFSRKIGAFSINAGSISDVKAAFEYSVRVLQSSSRASLWIFPSGKITPYGSDPAYKDGFARIASSIQEATIVPVAIRAEYIDGQYPDVVILGGSPIPVAGKGASAIFKEGTDALDHLQSTLEGLIQRKELADFKILLSGKSSASDRYSKFKRMVSNR
ncbi:MAG: putative phospholipid/glycerol acyltransferase [Bacteroidetes bacterium]|nr:putative phospholipid/glycerol acyltransferase [Bacteroidota bacterium]